MTRLIPCLFAGASAAVAMFAQSPVAVAQSANEKVNMVIIYGDDKCPESVADEITVCARKDEGERYRIPEPFRGSQSSQNEAWTNKVLAYEKVTASGTQSCSAAGAGGWTGCAGQFIHNAYAEKKAATDVNFSKMIADARAKREAATDADAADTQARVEAAEKDYDARQRAKADKAEAEAEAQQGQAQDTPSARLSAPPVK